MKYDSNAFSDVEVVTTSEEKDITLSKNAQAIIFQMFSKNIYSNPIGTVVREITSNCFDSHIEANVTAPILIKKTKDKLANTTYISFVDFGIGMSPDRIDNVFRVLFNSTKTLSNSYIGCYGLGSKSPLAYKRSTGYGVAEFDNSYFIITIFDGTKYTYQIYEGKDTPKINLLHTESTSEHNGTEVRIPVLEKDIDTFTKEMVRQLYYFENIIFEGFEDVYRYGGLLTNDYKIVKGKHFLFRGVDYSQQMHVCLGKVAYPIDFSVLGLYSSDYNLPIALRLEVGEVGVTVSRENLDYNENTIKVIKKRLESAKEEIKDLISKQYENFVTLEDYFQVKNDFGYLRFDNGLVLNAGNLIKQSDIDFSSFAYSFMKMPNDEQLFDLFFSVKAYGKKPKRSRYSSGRSSNEFNGSYKELKSKGIDSINRTSNGNSSKTIPNLTLNNLLHITDTFNRKVVKQAYLKSLHELYHIISKRDLTDTKIKFEVSELFNVHIGDMFDSNGKLNTYIESLINMQDEYFDIVQKYSTDYDSIEVPDDFVASRKTNKVSSELRTKEINFKIVGQYGKYSCNLDALFNYEMPIFYGTEDDNSKLTNTCELFKLLFDDENVVKSVTGNKFITQLNTVYYSNKNKKSTKSSIMFIQLPKSNIKYMQYCKKAYHVDQFFWRMLHRKTDVICEYFQMSDIVKKYQNIGSMYKDVNFSKLDNNWGGKINLMKSSIAPILSKFNKLNQSIGHYRTYISKYIDLDGLKLTNKQQKINKLIDKVVNLEKDNAEILTYIKTPYDIAYAKDAHIQILKNNMIF